MSQYTKVEQAYMCSKVRGIKWPEISESLRSFWKEWRYKELLANRKHGMDKRRRQALCRY